jgi:hypothetical protein
VAALQGSLDIEKGPLLRVGVFRARDAPGEVRLALVAHHLVMDGVSQRILADDLFAAYASVVNARKAVAPGHLAGRVATASAASSVAHHLPESSSSTFDEWCLHALNDVVPRLRDRPGLAPWPIETRPSNSCPPPLEALGAASAGALHGGAAAAALVEVEVKAKAKAEAEAEAEAAWRQTQQQRRAGNTEGAAATLLVAFDESETAAIFGATSAPLAPVLDRFTPTELFLAALALAHLPLPPSSSSSVAFELVVDLEGHGREAYDDLWGGGDDAAGKEQQQQPAVDVAHTVGWFTAMYPVTVTLPPLVAHAASAAMAAARYGGAGGKGAGAAAASVAVGHACQAALGSGALVEALAWAAGAHRRLPERRSLFGLTRLAEATDPRCIGNSTGGGGGGGRLLFNFLGFFGERSSAGAGGSSSRGASSSSSDASTAAD